MVIRAAWTIILCVTILIVWTLFVGPLAAYTTWAFWVIYLWLKKVLSFNG